MITITISDAEGKIPLLTLKTEQKSLARSVALIVEENQLTWKAVAEVAPKEVKFRNMAQAALPLPSAPASAPAPAPKKK